MISFSASLVYPVVESALLEVATEDRVNLVNSVMELNSREQDDDNIPIQLLLKIINIQIYRFILQVGTHLLYYSKRLKFRNKIAFKIWIILKLCSSVADPVHFFWIRIRGYGF